MIIADRELVEDFKTENEEDVSVLFIRFLLHLLEFDFESNIISIKDGKYIPKSDIEDLRL